MGLLSTIGAAFTAYISDLILKFFYYIFRINKKEFSLEDIYTNKNYKSPPTAR